MKLMLFLSHNGILSRRKAFDAIKNGAVAVNGHVDREPGTILGPKQLVGEETAGRRAWN